MRDKLRTPSDSVACTSTFTHFKSNNFLYDFISLSHRSGGILTHSSLQRCSGLLMFVGIYLWTALATAFQSG